MELEVHWARLGDLSGKQFALIDLNYSGISGGWGNVETFVLGLRKIIFINQENDEVRVSISALEGNVVDPINSPESSITIHDDGREISYQNERFTQFSDIDNNDVSIAGSQWTLALPAVVAAACPSGAAAASTTINLSRGTGNVLLIQNTQRSVGCEAHMMNFGEHPISNESIRKISADQKWLWLSEGIYQRASN